jgi:hypothetical protein
MSGATRAPPRSWVAREPSSLSRLTVTTTYYRPRSVSELVDAAFQLLRRDYMQYVMLMAIAYVPWLVILMATGLLTATPGDGAGVTSILVMGLGAMIWFSLIDAVMIDAVSSSYLGGRVDIAGSFRRVSGRFGHVLAAVIAKALMVFVGLMFLIVPGLYFLAKYFAVPATIVLEERGAGEGLGRSSTLSEGLKGHVLKTLVLVWGIYVALSFAVGVLGGAAAVFSQSATLLIVFTQVVNAAFRIFLYPLIPIVQTLLYYDARIRKEGYDLELMAQGLGVSEARGARVAT